MLLLPNVWGAHGFKNSKLCENGLRHYYSRRSGSLGVRPLIRLPRSWCAKHHARKLEGKWCEGLIPLPTHIAPLSICIYHKARELILHIFGLEFWSFCQSLPWGAVWDDFTRSRARHQIGGTCYAQVDIHDTKKQWFSDFRKIAFEIDNLVQEWEYLHYGKALVEWFHLHCSLTPSP